MNIQPTNKQPISDDQELAKVLAGITASADQTAVSFNDDDNQNTSPVIPQVPSVPADNTQDEMIGNPEASPQAPMPTFDPMLTAAPVAPAPVTAAAGSLDSIKNDALNELRPLVDKLNVSAQEKFDTYLLLIRSTDDTSLIGPAFAAARGITDEASKAQALLDIVKEIDYLSGPQKAA